uniref:Ig-like domain-containing protein n=1 Tax=Oreochromis aureus TaxID=47969 RepID=A0AAZ1Y046_OREAU
MSLKKTKLVIPSWTQIYRGTTVTVRCEIHAGEGAQWTYEWKPAKLNTPPTSSVYTINRVTESDGGGYSCRGTRSSSWTECSDIITLRVTGPTVTLQPSWTQIYSGETVIVRCEIQGGEGAQWTYEWRPDKLKTRQIYSVYTISRATKADSGGYSCRGRRFSWTEWSDITTLTVLPKPKAELRADRTAVPVGGSVTLTCSVISSSGWKYYWYTHRKSYQILTNGQISVSEGGLYWCRGGRGEPVYYTEWSKSVWIDTTEKSSSYELLPDGSGTAQDSYIIHGQTHTAGYVCRAGRGDPEYHTDHSQPKFVWSAGQFVSLCPFNKLMLGHHFYSPRFIKISSP